MNGRNVETSKRNKQLPAQVHEEGKRKVETGERREETGDRRQETGDRRQETGDRREMGERKRETGCLIRPVMTQARTGGQNLSGL